MLTELYNRSWQEDITGPWLAPKDLLPYFEKWSNYEDFKLKEFGRSEEGRPLRYLQWGKGPAKVVIWSQMHGNEATATLTLIDIIEFFHQLQLEGHSSVDELSARMSITFIPMLNPDGAERFTRRNAYLVDMNRDAVKQQSAEMRAFFQIIRDLEPDWTFNLHDQRSIFSVGSKQNCATLSYLAPSPDENRSKSESRIKTMQLIAAMHDNTAGNLAGHFGRYSDEFYPRAVGDNLMAAGIPCILLEAGAFPGDPLRSQARSLIMQNLIQAFIIIASKTWSNYVIEDYEAIPENEQALRDILLRDVKYKGQSCDIALQEKQELVEGEFRSYYILDDVGDLPHLKGICEYNGGFVELLGPFSLQHPVNFLYSEKSQKLIFKDGHIS
jgi:hypothetical protein